MIDSGAWVVRPAEAGDLDGVLALHVGQDNRRPGPALEPELRTWHEMMTTPGLRVYVAEIRDQVVGTATSLLMPNITYDCAPTVFVEAVVVVAEQRRRGIATSILERILADARARGCNKVQLLSHKRHAADGAHRLYGGLGFEPEAEGFRLYLRDIPVAVREARNASPPLSA